jgi:hypothetical protein
MRPRNVEIYPAFTTQWSTMQQLRNFICKILIDTEELSQPAQFDETAGN